MRIKKHLNKAFTLIELLLFTALFSVVLGVLVSLFSVIVDTQNEVQSTSAVENDSKYIISRFMYDIQRADSMNIPTNIGDESSTLSLTIDGETFLYGLDDGNLQLTVDGEVDSLNTFTTELTELSFTRLGNTGGKNAVQIEMTIDSRNPSAAGAETKTVNTMIGLR